MFGVTAPGVAGEAVIFDDPGLVGYRNNGPIYGSYSAENEKFSCSFLFLQNTSQIFPDHGDYTDTKLLTFVPSDHSFEFSNRDKSFDINGDLYRNEDEWVIQTSSGQAGCENATGGFTFDVGSEEASRFHIKGKIPAIGIRIVKRKSYLYNYRDGYFLARKSYLAKWNVVVALKSSREFSLVRFTDPRLDVESYGRVTIGWVHTADLVDPFPVANER